MTHYTVHTANELRTPSLPADARGDGVQALAKDFVASDTPQSHGLLRSAREHAIYLDSVWVGLRGYSDVFALMLLLAGVLAFYPLKLSLEGLSVIASKGEYGLYVVVALLTLTICLSILFALGMALRGFRIGLFSPKDLPLVFNRKTRKVYTFAPQVPELTPSWATLRAHFKPWPMQIVEYDWDCLEAEYFESTVLIGNVVKTNRVLQLYARESPGSNTVVGGFVLGSPLMVGREVAMDVWEYIRRYMQENGPVLCQSDQPALPHPSNILQSAQRVAPYYALPLLAALVWSVSHYMEHRFPVPGGTFFNLVLFIAAGFGGFTWLAIVFNWLSFRFCGQDVTLPPELLKDAGAKLNLRALAAQARAG